VAHLLNQGIDKIYTTTSIAPAEAAQQGVELIDIAPLFQAQEMKSC